MLEAFQSVYDYLIKKNFKQKLHVMDNECSKVIPPSEQDASCEIFCCAALANTIDDTLYTYLTGRFPI